MPKRIRSLRVRLRVVAATILVASALIAGTRAQRIPAQSGPPNYDIRSQEKEKDETGATYRARLAADPQSAATLANARAVGLARLRAAFPNIDITDNPDLGTPEIVSAGVGGGFLTRPTTDRAGAMRAFLSAYADAYGLSPADVAGFELVADYMNPAGNMAWVEFEQRLNGLPVFQGLLRGGFTGNGELARTTGPLATGVDPSTLSASASLSASEAITRATANVGWKVSTGGLVARTSGGDRFTFARGSMSDDAKAWLVYFPLAPGVARLAWATEIIGDPDGFLIVFDAADGTLLFRKNLTNYQTQSATYNVYPSDSPAPASPSPALPGANYQAPAVARQTFILIGNEAPNTFNNLGWMTDGLAITDGNNVEAGMDLISPDGIESTVPCPSRVCSFAYNPAPGMPPPGDPPTLPEFRNGEAANMFYWTNRYHDFTYLLGFNEAARNFQNDNFGRGGVAADRIRAEGQDFSGTNNANFLTPADGGRGRMQMYIFTGPTPDRSSGIDQDVMLHELTHGLSNRLHNNGSGLSATQSGGMGEGWSDCYARSILSDAGEAVNGIYTTGGWVTLEIDPGFTDNYYYGIRRFPYSVKSNLGGPLMRPHNPITFADIDPTQINLNDGAYPPAFVGTPFQVHNIGEVWCSALLEVRARIITRLGFATGNNRFLQFVTDGMKLDPVNPTLLQGRDSIIAAANAGGGTAADIDDIWRGFATRGMGVLASTPGPTSSSVTESFLTPSDPVPSFSIDDVTVTEGNVGSKVAKFTVTLANPSAATSTVAYATADATATTPSFTFTSAGPITINDNAAATPYPVPINVAALVGNVAGVSLRLNGLTHTFPADLDILVVAPGGQKFLAMSDVGGGGDVSGITLTLQDGAALPSTTLLVTGTVAPSNIDTTTDVMPGPAPAGPYGNPAPAGTDTFASIFGGTAPNGTWNIWVRDDLGADVGTITSISLIITTTAAGDYQPAQGVLSFPPGTTTQPVNVLINGDLTVEPNEAFRVNLTAPTNAVIGDSQGIGTILNDDLIYVAPGDFDGDGKTDSSVTRNGPMIWHIFNNAGYTGVAFGDQTQDIRVPGDYDGDGVTDIAVWRPSNGTFFVLKSSNGAVIGQQFGQLGDDPRIVGDYDGDGKDDFAVYRPGNPSVWWVLRSGTSTVIGTAFGQTGDKPAPGDYDGDGKFDLAVARDTGGGAATFFILRSTLGFFAAPWGLITDSILSGDYDGDGLYDIVVARQVAGAWNHYVRRMVNGALIGQVWGLSTDFLTPGDYDGDNKTDFAVWRPGPTSVFYALRSSNGTLHAVPWGISTDYPVMFFIVH